MVSWQAKQLCPELVLVPPQYDEYLKYSKLAHGIYERYTPLREPFGMPVLTPAFFARSDLARTIPCRSSTEPHTATAFPFKEGSNIISTEA